MNENQNPYYSQNTATPNVLTLSKYAAQTYLWMFLGLIITFGVAFVLEYTGAALLLFAKMPALVVIVPIVEIVTVIVLTAALKKITTGAATALFILYAALTGLTFSILFASFSATSAIAIFGITAIVFGIMAVWGYTTKQDLTSWGRVLIFGLIGLILVSLLGLFINLSKVEKIVSYIGVILFLAYTAYDTQKIKSFYFYYQHDEAMLKKASIIAALQLYLDFINIFLYLLRLFGKRK